MKATNAEKMAERCVDGITFIAPYIIGRSVTWAAFSLFHIYAISGFVMFSIIASIFYFILRPFLRWDESPTRITATVVGIIFALTHL